MVSLGLFPMYFRFVTTVLIILVFGWQSLLAQNTQPVLTPSPIGLNPQKRLTQYLVRNWTIEDGLPRNNVLAAAQTSDGYLWFGGFAGLVRFDGVSFQVINSHTDSTFRTDGVYALLADDHNNLWIGTQGGGLVRYQNGTFYQAFQDSVNQQLSVFTLARDHHGGLWLATSDGIKYWSREGQLSVPDELGELGVRKMRELLVDSEGNLWIGTPANGLYRYDGNELHLIGQEQGLPSESIYSLSEGKEGSIWVGTWNGLARVNGLGQVLEVHTQRDGQPTRSLDASFIDQQGSLWVGGLEGLGRYYKGKWKLFEPRVGFQLKEISTIFQDRQGSLWVGTYRHGIWQVTDGKFANFSIPEGLSGGVSYAVLAEEDAVYVGTESGLAVITPEGVREYTLGDGNENFVRDIVRDQQGRLWLCTYGGLVEWDGRVKRRIRTEQGFASNQIRSLAEDRGGTVWVATRKGLYQLVDGKAIIPEGLLSLADIYILSVLIDQEDHVWIGTNGNGLYRWDGDSLVHYTREDGLGNDFVFRMAEDGFGNLWVGTTGGLSRIKEGQVANLTTKGGLPANVVFQPIVDQRGRLWGIGDANVWSCRLEELNHLLDGEKGQLTSLQMFDKYDGLLAGQPTGVSVSALGSDEKLYVCTPLGVSVLDLTADHQYPHPPMLIDMVVTDHDTQRMSKMITLKAGNRRMAIHYTAFEYFAPHALRFQHQLEGFDPDWEDAGTQRTAVYTNLEPGEYTFKLRVASYDGEWSEEILTMQVIQGAYFYQTNAFKFILFFCFIGMGIIIHFSRIRLLEAHNKRLSQLVSKRTQMIEKQKEAIENQAHMLESSYVKINDSIQYARRIQDALLPSTKALRQVFPDSFILYRPKDVVSGDFYWFQQADDKFILAVVDCTGHGIPGAFMSVLGNTLLSHIVNQQHLYQPADILRELHLQTILHLQQDDHYAQMEDGMDLAICVIDFEDQTLSYGGARRPLLYLSDHQLRMIKPDRFSIGAVETREDFSFAQHTLNLADIQQFFMFSDGYADQFGGVDSRKFMSKRFKALLQDLADLPPKEQGRVLETTLLAWKGQEEQVDDILVVGVQLNAIEKS